MASPRIFPASIECDHQSRLIYITTSSQFARYSSQHYLSQDHESPSYLGAETVVSGQGRSFPTDAVSAARARMGKTIQVSRTHKGNSPIILFANSDGVGGSWNSGFANRESCF